MKMKLQTLSIIAFLLLGVSIFAQDKYGADPEECKMNLSLFHESVKAKNFEEAFTPWKSCYDNCPSASVYIYTDGLKIAKDKIKNGDATGVDLVNEIYAKRIKFYPKRLGKVYSDWASFLTKQGASEDEIFEKLDLAYKANPSEMSAKNIFKFFKFVTNKYENTDVQYIFDTMDNVNDAVEKKVIKLTKEYTALNAKIAQGETLSKKEKRRVKTKFFEINLGGLGKIEGGLNATVDHLMTCERLVPMYTKAFESNKTNVKWLKRATRKLNSKGCNDDPLYVKIIESWADAEESVEVYKFLANEYRKQGRVAEAETLGKKIFEMGTSLDKAKYLYSQSASLFKSGKYSQARSKARQALKYEPSFGKAYILIARMYAKSANRVGTDELSKRMVYVAAVNKISQAIKSNPSLSSTGRKYIKSYKANYPSKTVIFSAGLKTGDSHKIAGWIGETVRIP